MEVIEREFALNVIMRWFQKKSVLTVLLVGLVLLLTSAHHVWAAPVGLPTLDIKVGQSNNPQDISKGLQIIVIMTILALAPSFLIMATGFTRIVIVLSLIRHAIGSPTLPPNQIITGLALILTFFVMAPTFSEINTKALQPYLANKMPQQEALNTAMEPLRGFMFRQVSRKDVGLFIKLAKIKAPTTLKDVPTYVLLPAFIISELKTSFQLGFVIFLPFLVIDVVISSILVSMGMMFLQPATISLPFKLVLFVLVDGWHLISEALVLGFH